MADQPARRSSGVDKRGGYTGGGPAASMRPPAKIPSGAFRPAPAGNGFTGNGSGKK